MFINQYFEIDHQHFLGSSKSIYLLTVPGILSKINVATPLDYFRPSLKVQLHSSLKSAFPQLRTFSVFRLARGQTS